MKEGLPPLPIREITLVVDDKWFEAIANLTSDIYEGEVCEWVKIELL
jgi:hypothetical protein